VVLYIVTVVADFSQVEAMRWEIDQTIKKEDFIFLNPSTGSEPNVLASQC